MSAQVAADEPTTNNMQRIAVGVAGVLIAGAITGATVLLIEALREQGIQHEQVVAINATLVRIERRLEHIEAQMSTQTQRERDREAIDHNWAVIQRLRVRLQTVEHTLWPPTGAWRGKENDP